MFFIAKTYFIFLLPYYIRNYIKCLLDEKTHSEREDRMFQNNAYLRIGQMGQQGNTPKRTMVLASTSHKKPDGSYEDDFSGFVGLCGEAKIIYEQATAAGDPHPVIKMTDCGVTSRYDAATHKTYTNFMVFKGEYQPPKPKAQDNGQVLQQATPQQAPVTQQFVPTQAAPAIAPFMAAPVVPQQPVMPVPTAQFAPAQTPVAPVAPAVPVAPAPQPIQATPAQFIAPQQPVMPAPTAPVDPAGNPFPGMPEFTGDEKLPF